MGFTADGQRIKTLNARGAYMQINSESQKPRPCPPITMTTQPALPQPVATQAPTVVSTAALQQPKGYLEELLQSSAAAAAASTSAQQLLGAAAAAPADLNAAWNVGNAFQNALRLQQQRYYNPAALAAAYLQQNSSYNPFYAWRSSLTVSI